MKTNTSDRTNGFDKEATVTVQGETTRSVIMFNSEFEAEHFVDVVEKHIPLCSTTIEYEHKELPF